MKSKRFCCALSIFILIAFESANAQDFNNLIGYQGGLNFSSIIRTNSQANSEAKAGFSGGMFYERKINTNFSLHVEVNYENKGFQEAVTFTDDFGNVTGTGVTKSNFDYLTVPFLVRYYVGNDKTRFMVDAGPYFGFLLKQTFVFPGNIYPDQDLTDDYSRVDVGVSAGAGVYIYISERVSGSFEIRENYGLTTLERSDIISSYQDRNQSVVGFAGIAFHF